ncbi:MAG TPA: TaqI-like C-terminal specificity domain-containing protein [Clostridiales bacterium]|nr:TaqI-like C-terminal specificity domain-containing protein [Clostridiales bacterium]HQP69553.1 TaqI-like C-terminal specificity domain-containing protein [Clostridiales bacterium]
MKFKFISAKEAASLLNVSTATVSNWARSGMLEKSDSGFLFSSVKDLKNKIISGEINKLTKRANRFYSSIKRSEQEKEPNNDDAYQSGKSLGTRSREGSFYTPDHIIKDILKDYSPKKGTSLCDPCCGTGRFIKHADLLYRSGILITGYDTDRAAVKIANENFAKSGQNEICLKYFDSLLNPENEKYDFIFTNPPWGAELDAKKKKLIKANYPEAGSSDSLEYFIHFGFRALKNNGILSYILPESVLYVKKFSRLREFMLKEARILKIFTYGRIFPDVFSKTIRIDLKKNVPDPDHKIKLKNSYVKQNVFLYEPDNILNIEISGPDRKRIEDIYSKPHITLKKKAEWCLGVVTGNNGRFLSDARTADFIYEAVSGINVSELKIIGKSRFLYKDFSKFQQVPKNDIFTRPEKLIYRFISEKLVFAYDITGKYSTNSANILIPHLEGYTIKSVMAILNSDLMDFIYRNKFHSLKVLRSNLERLPFPKNPDKKIINLIDDKTSCIINNVTGQGRIRSEINALVNKLFGV